MNYTVIIVGSIVGVLVFLFVRAYWTMKNTPLPADNERIISLTASNFEQETKGRVVLIDFWAQWCGPCRMMAPVFNDLAQELPLNKYVGKVDIEANPSLAQRYNVRSIPTILLLQNGKEVKRFVGVQSKEFLLQQINGVDAQK